MFLQLTEKARLAANMVAVYSRIAYKNGKQKCSIYRMYRKSACMVATSGFNT